MQTYTGTYQVYKVFRKSGRRTILRKGLTESEAQRMVVSHPSSNTSMVVYSKQFSAAKYFTQK